MLSIYTCTQMDMLRVRCWIGQFDEKDASEHVEEVIKKTSVCMAFAKCTRELWAVIKQRKLSCVREIETDNETKTESKSVIIGISHFQKWFVFRVGLNLRYHNISISTGWLSSQYSSICIQLNGYDFIITHSYNLFYRPIQSRLSFCCAH